MVILGLGSNVGDRLENLRTAFNELKKIDNLTIKKVSPVYISDALIPENAPSTWCRPHLNLALLVQTKLTPHELLPFLKKIEQTVGRKPEKKWGPRVIDIDILAWDDLIISDEKLHIPHEGLHERPFALWPLADLWPQWIYPLPGKNQGKTAAEMVERWGSRFSGAAPLHTKQIPHRIDTPKIVGILNLTPDSFSNDGFDNNTEKAIQHLYDLAKSGAEYIDIGAESTNPQSQTISATEEWERLSPFMSCLKKELADMSLPPKISIDTRHAETAKKALDFPIDCINAVSGLEDSSMQEILSESNCDIILMHHLGIPASNHVFLTNYPVTSQVFHWAEDKLNSIIKKGINLERIIFDIGIGFGKNADQSLNLIQEIGYFKKLNTRLLVGHSRKRFLKLFTDCNFQERDLETVMVSLFLSKQKIDYIRVHNVDSHARAFRIFQHVF